MIKRADRSLSEIWCQVPPDYYQQSIKKNLLQRIWHQKKIKKLSRMLANYHYQKILDLGCAGGWMTNQIKISQPDSQIYGVDIYSKAINTAKRLYPDIIFKCADAHKLPFPDQFFNLIICYETIEHVIKPGLVLDEIKRVLKEDGKMILAMDSGSLLFRLVWLVWEKTRGRVWHGAHLHPFKHEELERLIMRKKFRVQNKYFTHAGLEVVFELSK